MMKNLIVVVVLSMITGCASVPIVSIEEKSRRKVLSDDAMAQSINCGSMNVAKVDDSISDASTIAMALAASCRKEYSNSVEAFIASKVDDNENVKRLLRNKLNSKESKIETYLSIVTNYRNMKNKLKIENTPDVKKNEIPKSPKSI
jgi:hypothetical protein